MTSEALLRKLEGLHTVDTLAEDLGLTRQATINFASKLKKEHHLTSSGGGKQKRFYNITARKQLKRDPGMFDILNRNSPKMKLAPWYDHQVHGRYTTEDAIVDAIKTKSFRATLITLRSFNHITDWPRLYDLAKKNNCWQEVGALYDTARLFFRVRNMPKNYNRPNTKKWRQLTKFKHKSNFPEIENKWKINIPFNKYDIQEV